MRSPRDEPAAVPSLSGRALDDYFGAVVDASEEAVLDSLLSATTTTGVDGRTIDARPAGRVRELL
jgi:D-aminopeptidase